jgi:uncharacterized protein YjbI with pentapeptide repeats
MPRWIPVTIGKTQDWSGTDIRGASLVGANMPFCSFSGSILMGCDLSWSVMQKCDFSDAVMDAAVMVGADIKESRFDRAKMHLANLSGRVNASYISARHADMSGVKAAEINLSYASMSGATLEGAMMSMARLNHADLQRANMKTVQGLRITMLCSLSVRCRHPAAQPVYYIAYVACFPHKSMTTSSAVCTRVSM